MKSSYPYGKTFKYFREVHELALKEAAGNVVTPQFLSKFEKGESQITMDKLNRLLIANNINLIDFFNAYINQFDGPDVEQLTRMHYMLLTEGFQTGSDTFYHEFKERLSQLTSYDDAIIEDYLQLTRSNHHNITLELLSDKSQWQKITRIPLKVRSELELQNVALQAEQFPLPLLLKEKGALLDALANDYNVSRIMAYSGYAIYIIRALSRRGHYVEVEKMIDAIEVIYSKKELNLDTNLVLNLSMQKTFNLLRQNKPEGISLAKRVLNFLEHPILAPYARAKVQVTRSTFIAEVEKLNQTGQSIFE